MTAVAAAAVAAAVGTAAVGTAAVGTAVVAAETVGGVVPDTAVAAHLHSVTCVAVVAVAVVAFVVAVTASDRWAASAAVPYAVVASLGQPAAYDCSHFALPLECD